MKNLLELCLSSRWRRSWASALPWPPRPAPTHTLKFEGPKANTGTVSHSTKAARASCACRPISKCPIRPLRPGAWSTPRQCLHPRRLQDKGGEKREVQVPGYVKEHRQGPGLLRLGAGASWRDVVRLARELNQR